jgi:glutamyl-tRNA synthetase
VTAFPPEPSKDPHLGHAKSALVNFEYAKKYSGKFILRFEDSNPERAEEEFYGAILDGIKWLGIKWDKLDYLSDHMPEYYREIEKLIRKERAYVCLCDQETVKKLRAGGEPCAHRNQTSKGNMELWKDMLEKMAEGDATVRIKIDMKSLNTTLRDPSIARIITKSHVRTKKKYRVWPVYDFGTALLDGWEGVTHRVRTKEFELRKDLQDYILNSLGYKVPHITEIGRFQIKGAVTQGRDIREGIHSKQFSGWDDPRLTTLTALRRRGFVPEAIKEFLLSTGITKTESEYDWQSIESFNRKAIDPTSDRYFGVIDPEKVKVEGLPKEKISVFTRPGSGKKRTIDVKSDFVYVERADASSLKGHKVGLMFLGTVDFGVVNRFVSKDIAQETPKIHWVSESSVPLKVVMPDGKARLCVGEAAMKKLKVGSTIQLYRVGFCRVDKVGAKDVTLFFAHK